MAKERKDNLATQKPPSVFKILILLILLIAMTLANGLATAIANEFVDGRPPLYDYGFQYIPYTPTLRSMPDLALFVGLICVFISLFKRNWRQSIADMAWICISVYFIRCFCILSTSIPPPFENSSEICAKPLDANADWQELIKRSTTVWTMMLGSKGDFVCGDYVFSIHATVYTLAVMALYWSYGFGASVIGIACWASGAYGLIASRRHYSIDVILATVISSAVFLAQKNYTRGKHVKID